MYLCSVCNPICTFLLQDELITDSNVEGHLCIKKPWPGMARTIYGNHESFMDIYYHPHQGTGIYIRYMYVCTIDREI